MILLLLCIFCRQGELFLVLKTFFFFFKKWATFIGKEGSKFFPLRVAVNEKEGIYFDVRVSSHGAVSISLIYCTIGVRC